MHRFFDSVASVDALPNSGSSDDIAFSKSGQIGTRKWCPVLGMGVELSGSRRVSSCRCYNRGDVTIGERTVRGARATG